MSSESLTGEQRRTNLNPSLAPVDGIAPIDAEQFIADATDITNRAAFDEAIVLFHPDCVAEWIFDGMYERHVGIEAIGNALRATLGVFRDHKMYGRKTLECFDGQTVVNTWRGGFHGDHRQFGTELWTLRDGLVIHHQMYTYLKVTRRWSPTGILRQLRVVLTSPRIATSQLKHELR
jgi:hypothetical protein